MSSVNGQGLAEGLSDQRTWTIGPLAGVNASAVVPDGYDSGDANNPHGVHFEASHNREGSRPWALWDGGVTITARVGDWFTYRFFLFKNEATLEAARSNASNAGLQYAQSFPGASGCNAEVVLELTPKSGGGLDVSAAMEQMFTDVIKTVSWYATADEVVVLAAREQLNNVSRVSFTPKAECAPESRTSTTPSLRRHLRSSRSHVAGARRAPRSWCASRARSSARRRASA